MIKPILSAAMILVGLSTMSWAEGDPEKGEKIFKKCKACHAVGEGAKNKVGPPLNGIVGAAAAQNPDFKYSDGMQTMAAEGLVWDEANLTVYLTKPKDLVKGTKMSFAGLRKEKDINDVIAYLNGF